MSVLSIKVPIQKSLETYLMILVICCIRWLSDWSFCLCRRIIIIIIIILIIIIIIVIIIIIYYLGVFTSVLADGLLLNFEWQQVSLVLLPQNLQSLL